MHDNSRYVKAGNESFSYLRPVDSAILLGLLKSYGLERDKLQADEAEAVHRLVCDAARFDLDEPVADDDPVAERWCAVEGCKAEPTHFNSGEWCCEAHLNYGTEPVQPTDSGEAS